jgi:hypothetical protein
MNQPAFPMTGFETRNGQGIQLVHHTGMTLRDYFAAKAMQGMLAACTGWSNADQDRMARTSYRMADEMLKEREA